MRIQWVLYDDVDYAQLYVFNESGQLLWRVAAYDSDTELTIPEAPSAVNEAVFLGSEPKARLFVGTDANVSGANRRVRTAMFRLAP